MLKTFVMEALIQEPDRKPEWYEVLSFLFHTTGEHPMVEVWNKKSKYAKVSSFIFIKGFRVKE